MTKDNALILEKKIISAFNAENYEKFLIIRKNSYIFGITKHFNLWTGYFFDIHGSISENEFNITKKIPYIHLKTLSKIENIDEIVDYINNNI